MKLATIKTADGNRIAAIVDTGSRTIDLKLAWEAKNPPVEYFESMLSLIDGGARALDCARKAADFAMKDGEASLEISRGAVLAPIPVPRQFRDAMSFPLHILQAPRGRRIMTARLRGDETEATRIASEVLPDLPPVYRKHPIFYITSRLSVAGHDHTVEWPQSSNVMDYELELAVVTSCRGKNIPVARAKDFVFGYTIFNDFSARDIQGVEMEGRLGPAKGKSFDGGNVIGPWIVTADEIPDPSKLRMQARVNGEVRCDSCSEGMLYSFEELISYISRDETIDAGEIIGSGTVGNGCELEHGRWLNDGDVVELEIEKIGTLRNTVCQSGL